MRGLILAAALLIALCAPARAETRRLAVLVGSNDGAGELPPLRFAESDAAKLGDVLVELGGIRRDDLLLVRGGGRRPVERAMTEATARIATWRRAPGTRVVLIFYFSGHSDGAALELGADRLAFAELRRWLGATGADVRLALVDTCKSGALLAAKGGAPAPAFQIRFTEDLASRGEALLTSSAADEVALESREIGGSFFTHHLVSGLRGAADASGDGKVTLTEAYQYAYGHTLTTTGATLSGPQHPVYDYRLSGKGELVLTELSSRRARIGVAGGHQRVLIVDEARRQVVAEVGAAPVQVAVAPGRYLVRAWRDGRVREGRVAVVAGATRWLRDDDLTTAVATAEVAKGVLADEPVRAGLRGGAALWVAVGGAGGVADELGVLPSLRLGVSAAAATGASYTVALATGRGLDYRETTAMARVGYRIGWARRHIRGWLGAEVGAGAVIQTLDDGSADWSATAAVVPGAGAAVRAASRLWLTVDGEVALSLLQRDGSAAAELLPALRIGALVPL